jgi:hypothetical protein
VGQPPHAPQRRIAIGPPTFRKLNYLRAETLSSAGPNLAFDADIAFLGGRPFFLRLSDSNFARAFGAFIINEVQVGIALIQKPLLAALKAICANPVNGLAAAH